MTTGITQDHIEKQMGCMAGFLQLFDRHQMLSGKKFHTAKRLPPATAADASGSEKSSSASPDVSRELVSKQQTPKRPAATPSPEISKPSPAAELKSTTPSSVNTTPPKSPQPLPIFDLKEGIKSSWKFKETPRLSLDSRATYDAKGSLHRKEIRADRVILPSNPSEDAEDESSGDNDDKQRARSSTSVIARLMGLEPISEADPETVKPAELRRSASESRVTRDLFQHRFIDGSNPNNLNSKHPNQSHCNGYASNVARNSGAPPSPHSASRQRGTDPMDRVYRNGKSEVMGPSKGLNKGMMTSSSSSWKLPQHRRSFYEAAEVFPEPAQKQPVMSVYGEIERRLRMRGISEASKDLETLKQILEAWQLKGLLHSSRHSSEEVSHRNIVYDRSFPPEDSPIVVMRPYRSSTISSRIDSESPSFSRAGGRRNVLIGNEITPSVSPRRERNMRSPTRSRGSSSPTRNDGNVRRSKSQSVEMHRRVNESRENRKGISTMNSPWADQVATHRSGRISNKNSAGEIYKKGREDESCSISESTVSTSSQADTEKSKNEEYKEGGRSLLERCDKLLSSIAEMTGTDQQSSPVSVLDSSSFYDSSSPSPIIKRSVAFKDNSGELLEEEQWSQLIFSDQFKLDDASEDSELVYISEILRAAHYLPEDSDIFSLLEKQQCLKGKDTSKVSRLQRKLIFDTIHEILERNRQLPPWNALSWKDCISKRTSLPRIWSEFQKIRERDGAEDLVEIICGVLKKDLAGDAVSGWGECPVELSEVVLDIERMIFRDLVGETIREIALIACQSTVLVAPRRKLVF